MVILQPPTQYLGSARFRDGKVALVGTRGSLQRSAGTFWPFRLGVRSFASGGPRWIPNYLESLLARPAWQLRAACRGEGVGTFVGGAGASYGKARELCGGCPVRPECLRFALEDPDVVGYWEGTSTKERERMRRAAG
ncbi:MAG: WhiB family transcriptional regulator [Acidimicrobiales bacterium]